MKIDKIKIFIQGTLQDSLLDYLEGNEGLFNLLTLLVEKYVDRLLWDEDTIKRYGNWFFIKGEDLMNETRLGDEELFERMRALEEKSLIHIRDSYYSGCLLIKIDKEMFKSLHKLYEVRSKNA